MKGEAIKEFDFTVEEQDHIIEAPKGTSRSVWTAHIQKVIDAASKLSTGHSVKVPTAGLSSGQAAQFRAKVKDALADGLELVYYKKTDYFQVVKAPVSK